MELRPVYDWQDCMSHATFINEIWWDLEKHNHMYACVGKHYVY